MQETDRDGLDVLLAEVLDRLLELVHRERLDLPARGVDAPADAHP